MNLKASILPYTLMISALIGGLLGILSLTNFLASQLLNRHHGLIRAHDNLASGLNWFMTGSWEIGDSIQSTLGAMSNDSISLHSQYWGLWGLVQATAFHKQYHAADCLLMGQKALAGDKPGLWPLKTTAPLSLAGDCIIRGSIGCRPRKLRYSKAGVMAFTGLPLQESQFSSSSNRRNSLELLAGVKVNLLDQSPEALKMLFPPAQLVGNFSQDWKKPALWISAPPHLVLDKIMLAGKIVVDCPEEIEITEAAKLEHVLLFAKRIRIRAGFKGQLQAFASEKIRIDSGVVLSFPSILAITGEQKKAGDIYLQGNSRLEGAILLHQGTSSDLGYSYIGPGSIIRGLIWIEGKLDFRGKLQGRLLANEFETRLPARIYQHHLLSAHIEGEWPAKAFPMPILFPHSQYESTCSLNSLIP